MGAGAPQSKINAGVRKHLGKIIAANPGAVKVGKGEKAHVTGATADGLTWEARLSILRASNGEVWGMPLYTVTADGVSLSFSDHGLTLAPCLESFRARRSGDMVWVLTRNAYGPVDRTIAGADLDDACPTLGFASLSEAVKAQVALTGNRAGLYEARRGEALGSFYLIRAVPIHDPERSAAYRE